LHERLQSFWRLLSQRFIGAKQDGSGVTKLLDNFSSKQTSKQGMPSKFDKYPEFNLDKQNFELLLVWH